MLLSAGFRDVGNLPLGWFSIHFGNADWIQLIPNIRVRTANS